MKNPFFPVLALALIGIFAAPGPLRASDDTTRRAQQALRDGGFYYGPIDGAPGDDTSQAIRRYQIRNGLAVTGQLNVETLRALNINAAPPPSTPAARGQNAGPTPPPLNAPPPAPTPPPPRTITGRSATPTPPPRQNPPNATADAPPPPIYSRPDLRAGTPNLPPGAQATNLPLTGFFSRTPYEFAPPAVQSDVLRRAQRALGRGGFYDGPADGLPNRRTVEALGEFQGAFRLPRSRKLDVPTLRVLRLLPGANSNLPEPIVGRRRGEPDPGSDEEDEEDAPAVRIRPRNPSPEGVYQGRIIR